MFQILRHNANDSFWLRIYTVYYGHYLPTHPVYFLDEVLWSGVIEAESLGRTF